MDKNTIIGFSLIALIFVGFSILNRPSQEEIERQKKYNDSVALVEQHAPNLAETADRETQLNDVLASTSSDTTMNAVSQDAFGDFAVSALGKEEFYTLENNLLKLTFTNKGGRLYGAELKNFRTHDSLPLVLFNGEESQMAFTLVTSNNRVVSSADLYFEAIESSKTAADGKQKLGFRLKTSKDAYIDFIYTLTPNDYMLGFEIKAEKMNEIMPFGTNSLEMLWKMKVRQQEKGRQFEARYAQMMYKFATGDVEKLSESKNDAERVPNRLHWIAFKDQFFSSVFIAEEGFASANLNSTVEPETSSYLKSYASDMTVAFDPQGESRTNFRMYLGPNQYKILNDYDKDLPSDEKLQLRKLVPLGWGIFGWLNRFLIIPIFNVLSLFIGNFGIIILLMTIIIKLIIFPMTYKSYMSSAKMRVLKPEIDEINARIPAEKAAERQKATMELYSKVGVSPMSGCLPMLLQMPILIAMFNFFPASIELRQENFLWVKDLSSYDAIFSWDVYIPLITPYFGNHISLFCLLMTAVTLLYNKLNTALQPTAADQPGMGMMKWMMYLMPIMFMFIFNNYAAGLTYYYFLSTLFSIGQTYLFRVTINEEKLRAELHAKKNSKTAKKKSSFMERLEKMQREQEKAMRNRKR